MTNRRHLWLIACLVLGTAVADDTEIRDVYDEADAALAIMETLQDGRPVSQEQWAALWESEGYRRLLEREASMGRDEGFADKLAAWLGDPANYSRAADIRAALDGYRSIDATGAGRRAAVYLPQGSALRASFYPVIKHTSNSFVYDLERDPAIFMSIDPANSSLFVASVLTHELHHVGYSRCAKPADYASLDERQQWVVDSLSMFGEGLATLAAAGDPATHPHFYSTAGEWSVWERDVANVNADLARVEQFFSRVLDGSIREADRRAGLFAFIATADVPQGPAYTLGWKMAALIERNRGRDALIAVICDPRAMLRLYNEVAASTQADSVTNLAVWSDRFLGQLHADDAQ